MTNPKCEHGNRGENCTQCGNSPTNGEEDFEELIDEQIDKIDEGLAIKKDEPNRLGIYTSATNLGTRKIEIKSIIRKEKELSKEEGRREILKEIGYYNAFILNEYQTRHGLTDQVMVSILTDGMNKHFPDIEDSLKTNSK